VKGRAVSQFGIIADFRMSAGASKAVSTTTLSKVSRTQMNQAGPAGHP